MDAKPTQGRKTRDENDIENSKPKSFHSRTNSSPALAANLAPAANTGAFGTEAKRSAFGDITTTTRGNRSLAGSSFGQTEDKTQEKKGTAFSQPFKKLAKSLSSSSLSSLAKATEDTQNKRVSKRATTIFRDSSNLSRVPEESQPLDSNSFSRSFALGTAAAGQQENQAAPLQAVASNPASQSHILSGFTNLSIPATNSNNNATAGDVSSSFNRELVNPVAANVPVPSERQPVASDAGNVSIAPRQEPIAPNAGNVLGNPTFGEILLEAPNSIVPSVFSLEPEVMPPTATNTQLERVVEYFAARNLPLITTTFADAATELPVFADAGLDFPIYAETESELSGGDENQMEHDFSDDDDFVTAQTAHTRTGTFSSVSGYTFLLMPPLSHEVQLELQAAGAVVRALHLPSEQEDDDSHFNIVPEYKEEIFAYWHELEVRLAPRPDYMARQTEITWSMRSILIDWVVQVHDRFRLVPETLYLAVNLTDRFLSVKVVSMNKLQLVGAVALFIASKYEEVNCPSILELQYMLGNTYSREEILKAEKFMLGLLEFELGWPSPMNFLRRVSSADDYDVETRTLAKYFLELTVMDERYLACVPSYLAAGAHCLARTMLGKGCWSTMHVHYSGYTYGELYPLLISLVDCLYSPRDHHATVYQKYRSHRFRSVASYARDQMMMGFRLLKPRDNAQLNYEYLCLIGCNYEYYSRRIPGYPRPFSMS